jgi:hypothetical protein
MVYFGKVMVFGSSSTAWRLIWLFKVIKLYGAESGTD